VLVVQAVAVLEVMAHPVAVAVEKLKKFLDAQ
jgi:hypothetical protein